MANVSYISKSEYDNAQAVAASQYGKAKEGCVECHEGNWIHVRYEYTEGDPVTDATFVVQKPNGGEAGGEVIFEGVVSIGPQAEYEFVHVDLGDYSGNVEVFFFDDPTEPVPYEEKPPVENEKGFFDKCADAVIGGTQWAVEVAMGDFKEDMSTGQVITNAVVTAIPGVDQVADARDLIANGKALIWDKRYKEIGVWVGVFACLIGLVPSLGSLAKGVLKLVWKNAAEMGKILVYINKALHKTGMRVNGYRFVKKLADELPSKVDFVSQKFDEFLDYCETKARSLGLTDALDSIDQVRVMAREKFEKVAAKISARISRNLAEFATRAWGVTPGQGIVVRRTTTMVRKSYDSWQETMQRIGFNENNLEAGAEPVDEAALKFERDAPKLAQKWYDELLADPNLPAYLRQQAEASPDFFKKELKTFKTKPRYEEFSAEQTLYRVIGKPNGHTGGFWSKDFPPDDEAAWRARDAVKNVWNEAGALIRARVPPPPAGLVGEIAPQTLENHPGMMLRGGGEQVWLPGPRGGAISRDQVISYEHTGWNDRGKVEPSRAYLHSAKINECDK